MKHLNKPLFFFQQLISICFIGFLSINTAFANPVNLLYFVSDGDDHLYSIDRNTGVITDIGACGVGNIEAIAYWPEPSNNKLYAANGGQLGTINLATGVFTALPNQVDGGGTANGSLGAQTLNDVDGLSFDPWTGILWGSERKGAAGQYDLIFQIDHTTGLFIPNAFGPGVDYLVIDGTGVYYDIDDMAIGTKDGLIYAVSNDGNTDQLININKYTGAVKVVNDLTFTDIEGMSFHNDFTFYGSTGNGGGAGSRDRLWNIDTTNANMTVLYDLGAAGATDVEALATLVADANTISGTVWRDANYNQILEGGEPVRYAGVKVELFFDKNANGVLDAGDFLIQTKLTDALGNYTFFFATTASLIVKVDQGTLPSPTALTTVDRYAITFADNVNFSEVSANNNFGAMDGPDCDGDGIPDFFEGTADTDGDGLLDQCDWDSDNDGIPDNVEGTGDCDADGIPNYKDIDNDNDGIPDALEANGGFAPAGYNPLTGRIDGTVGANGMADAIETAPESGVSTLPMSNTDGDVQVDYCDCDSDNDGILDVVEAGGIDVNGDGLIDGFADANSDGYHDPLNTTPLPVLNSDGLTGPNYVDIDSDNDGIDDTREGYSSPAYKTPPFVIDTDNDGVIDYWDISYGGKSITPYDHDSDGTPDYYDLDSDDDTILDRIEGYDVNRDGIVDVARSNTDTDVDGLDNNYDPNTTVFGDYTTMALQDYDGDGWQDWRDTDDDNDGIPTELEPTDTDLNVIVDYLEFGAVCNAVGPFRTGNAATLIDDFDFGTANNALGAANGGYADADNGSGGYLVLELTHKVRLQAVVNVTMRTSGGDNNARMSVEFSADGISWTAPMVQVINAGAFTNFPFTVNLSEGAKFVRIRRYPTGGTSELRVDALSYNFQECSKDTDGDGVTDDIDVDDDNDGILDVVEVCGAAATDFSCLGGADPNDDTDNDGIVNYQDSDYCTLNARGICATMDRDNDGIPNHLDLDADNDGIPDVIEAGGTDTDGDGLIDNFVDANNDGITDFFNPCATGSIDVTVAANSDDAEENTGGTVDLNSSDLELVDEATTQTVGVRFTGVNIPVGAIITNAYIQFTVDETGGANGNITIEGQSNANPATFTATANNISSRPTTTANQPWNPNVANWNTAGLAGLDQRTPNLSNVVQEIVGLGGWASGNAMVFIFTGSGQRVAESRNSGAATAPRLVVEYTIPCPFNKIPNLDTDGDGITNYLDLDADNDGIPDVVEAGGVDINGDGFVDNNKDVDGDGYADIYDSDDDLIAGVEDATDPLFVTGADTDSDELPNSYPTGDTDLDGILDYLDLDADNDGIPDVVEAGGTDENGDGRADDYVDTDFDGFNDVVDGDVNNDGTKENTANATQLTGADTNGDGRPNSYPNDDFDNDGIRDHLDLDADNDGIPDVIEAGGTDVTGDGIADNYTDADNDGFNDDVDGDPTNVVVLGTDAVGSNTANALQLTGEDADANGRPDGYLVGDTDGDGNLDHLDLDADNDGIPDIVEAGGADIDNNGIADNLTETDNDGFSDLYDTDTNNDGSQDAGPVAMVLTSADGDNNGAPDAGFTKGDLDGDGAPNHLDLDADNDGILDVLEAGLTASDVNRDGILDDALTNDGDNNGWSNTADQSNGGTSPIQTTDANADGYPDVYTTGDFEGDRHPNFLDIDADNDGIVDNTEGQDTRTYIAPVFSDLDGDGIDDAYDNNDAIFGGAGSGILPVNKDRLDEPDYLDLDTDNDGISDLIEGHDTDGDGVADAGSSANTGVGGALDIDNDGLLDGYDNNTASTISTNTALNPSSHPDVFNKKTIERDWRERNTTYATNDINTTPINVTVTGNVLTNDTDLEDNTQTVRTMTIDTDGDGTPETVAALGSSILVGGVNEDGTANANAGTLTQNTDGTYTFVPTAGFVGEVIYTYEVCDDGSPVACATARVNIDVEPDPNTTNGELAAAPDYNVTHEDIPVNGQVLANDNDPDGDALTVTGSINVDTNGDGVLNGTVLVGVSSSIGGITVEGTPFPSAGTIIQNANGTYTFDPVAGFIGVVNYEYTVCDDGIPMLCERTTVTIRVLPALYNSTNTVDDEEFMDQGTTLAANVLDNDYDVEGDDQSSGVTLVSTTTNGTLILNANGTHTYTPTDPDFSGNDEFVYSVCDDGSPTSCDTATVYITILPVNRDYGDAPAPYGIAAHRAIRDVDANNVLDGTADVWLGTGTSFEATTKPVDVDDFDDAMALGTATAGAFPRTVNPSTVYAVDLGLNSTSAATISYGMWVDWDNDGIYEDFYQATEGVAASGARTVVVNVTSPAIVTTTLVNIRLRVHHNPLVFADFQGQKTNGEVEDYQFLMNDPLPVEMLYFNAKLANKNTAVLDWATATELNNAGYDIEHALPTTGTPEFKKVGFVAGFGTTVNEQYYNYDVPNLVPGVHYFRLRQVDFDGTFTYTATKALEVKGGLVEKVFPTILTESSHTVYIQVAEDANYKVEVVTALGQTVQAYNAKLSATSYHEVYFDLNQYPSGVYFIRVGSKDASFTTKIRVQ